MTPLPKPSIDTGMGLERIVSVVQNVETNYGTDLFTPIIDKIQEISKIPFGKNKIHDISMKVIADHARASAFLIGDGILPSNEGKGYVLRRIMRRAIRYGRNLNLTKPFLSQAAEVVFEIMESAYPELMQNKSFINNVILNEEKRFIETLDNGLKILGDAVKEIKAQGSKTISGALIFKLYDTYGFPVDIVKDILRDQDFTLDLN